MSVSSSIQLGKRQAVGFFLADGLPEDVFERALKSKKTTLSYFPWLKNYSLKIGDTRLELWGHCQVKKTIAQLEDGSYAVLVGSPTGDTSSQAIGKFLGNIQNNLNFLPSWDGRYLLIYISSDGKTIQIYNDFMGCLPVYHSQLEKGLIISSLEPVVVDACGFGSDDFADAGVGSMLLNGHFVNEVTLYKKMKLLKPDSFSSWTQGNFKSISLHTIKPSTKRWSSGWDELCDAYYTLTKEVMVEHLSMSQSWALPLSGGIDSRLIAAFGSEMEIELDAFTYGPKDWEESIYAKKVAKSLGIPWRRIDFGLDYLSDYTQMWAQWFGSGMHFHGMYQLPYLEKTKGLRKPIATGFMGDVLAGCQVKSLATGDGTAQDNMLQTFAMWDKPGVMSLMGEHAKKYIDAVEHEMQQLYDGLEGEHFQKIWQTFIQSHGAGFTSYQPIMYDYYQGVSTPCFSRKLAQFTMELPRVLLEDRQLQVEMIKRYFPDMAKIPGTYASFPYQQTGKYLMKRSLALKLGKSLRLGPLKEFAAKANNADGHCVLRGGESALWPIYQCKEALSNYFNWKEIEKVLTKAMQGDQKVTSQYRAIQTIAYRLLDKKSKHVLSTQRELLAHAG